jgi:lactoylglutathione lyase
VKLNLIVLRAKDIDVLVEFYSALGCNFNKHKHGTGLEHYVHECGGAVFEIYPLSTGPVTAGVRIGF